MVRVLISSHACHPATSAVTEVDVLLHAPERQSDPAPDLTASVGARRSPRSVLVGVDGSDESRAAFMAALERAGPNDTVSVIHTYPPVLGWFGSPFYQQALDERLLGGERILRELRSSAALARTHVSFEQHEGRPAEVLARIAALREVDEIIVGTRRLGRTRAFMGSVSRALLRRANRPVLVVPHRAPAA